MTKHALQRGVSALGISLAVAVMAIAPASFAQPQQLPGQQNQAPAPQPQYPGQYYGQPNRYGDQGPAYGRDRRGDPRIDRRIAFLHQRLGITPAQEAAWSGFAGEIRTDAMSMDRAFERGREERRAMNAVDRLEQRERMLAARQTELDRMVRALRPLYASFSDEQKRVADQLLFPFERGPGGPGARYGRPGT